MAYAGPAGPGVVEHGADLVRAAPDAGVDHGRLVAAHQHVRRHEPEVDPRPGQLGRRGRAAARRGGGLGRSPSRTRWAAGWPRRPPRRRSCTRPARARRRRARRGRPAGGTPAARWPGPRPSSSSDGAAAGAPSRQCCWSGNAAGQDGRHARRGTRRRTADQSRPAVVRRLRSHQARPGRLPGRRGGPARAGARRSCPERHPGAAGAAAVHAEEPVRPTPPTSIPTLEITTQDGKKVVHYPVCNDRETLLWFANQRAVEYHPTLYRGLASDAPTHLVVDLDPPAGSDAFARAVEAAVLVRAGAQRRRDGGGGQDQRRQGCARRGAAWRRAAPPSTWRPPPARSRPARNGSTRSTRRRRSSSRRARARCSSTRRERVARPWWPPTARGRGPVSRCRSRSPGTTSPARHRRTSRSAPSRGLIGDTDPWTTLMPPPQALDGGLVEEGHTIPVARVAAMHEGKRRARAKREAAEDAP